MKSLVQMVCRECLRAQPASSLEEAATTSACPHCGGGLEANEVPEPSADDDHQTPLSLVLTPESLEHTPWIRTEPAREPGLVPAQGLGRFQIREYLGGGGFGDVYRAYDPRLDRMVALKVLRDAKPTARVMERFFREARAAAQLDHPNIVPVYDAGRDRGRCWIAYQFVEGKTLKQLIDEHAITELRTIAEVCRDIARALDHSHKKGVLHRDVKPSNILIDPMRRLRLMDFGLARRGSADATLTIEGTVIGTRPYLPPEQAAGFGHKADARSDVYSLGVILYELLCGEPPGDLPTEAPPWRVEFSVSPPPAPSQRNRRVPAALDRICLRALAFDPVDRYPNAQSLADDLDHWLSRQEARIPRTLLLGLTWGAAVSLVLGPMLGWFLAGLRSTTERAPSLKVETSPPPVRSWLQSRIDLRSSVFEIKEHGVFHRSGCSVIAHKAPEQLIRYRDAQTARSQGLRPCGVCFENAYPSYDGPAPDSKPKTPPS